METKLLCFLFSIHVKAVSFFTYVQCIYLYFKQGNDIDEDSEYVLSEHSSFSQDNESTQDRVQSTINKTASYTSSLNTSNTVGSIICNDELMYRRRPKCLLSEFAHIFNTYIFYICIYKIYKCIDTCINSDGIHL